MQGQHTRRSDCLSRCTQGNLIAIRMQKERNIRSSASLHRLCSTAGVCRSRKSWTLWLQAVQHCLCVSRKRVLAVRSIFGQISIFSSVAPVLRILLWRDVEFLSGEGRAGSVVSGGGSANSTAPGAITAFPSAYEELPPPVALSLLACEQFAIAGNLLPPPGSSSLLSGAPVHFTFRTLLDSIFLCSIVCKSML